MKRLLLAWLCFLHLCDGLSREVTGGELFMLLAGPLQSQKDVFTCGGPIPPGSGRYFDYLRGRGVTHFQVPLSWNRLLPSGHPRRPQQAVVRCYRTLLKQVLTAGLQPLVTLHASAVPEDLKSEFGGWESPELQGMFTLYAEFAFEEFGEFAHSWVILSHLDEVWHDGPPPQDIIQLIRNICQLYRRSFGDKAKVSVGLRASDVALLWEIQTSLRMDFLSLHFESNCASTFNLTQELTKLKMASQDVPILIYKMTLCDCADSRFQVLGNFLQGAWSSCEDHQGLKALLEQLMVSIRGSEQVS